MKPQSKILIIAGSDSSGGAGIQADVKTVTALGSYAMTAITAVTSQNTTGVKSVVPIKPREIEKQIEFSCIDIKPDAIKIGMLHSTKVILSVVKSLKKLKIKKIILDPVMVAKGGANLINSSAIKTLKSKLIKQTFLITPNIPEAEVLSGIKINTLDDMQSPILKFIEGECTSAIVKQVNATEGDLIFFGAGTSDVVNLSMSSLIKKIAEDHNLYVKDWAPVWIVDFPMFERNSEGNLTSLHHPFTLPKSKIEDFINSPESSLAHAYDLVLNGYEIGGGSLRVNEINIQREIFNILGISEDEAEEKFGFFLRSLAIGAPPHGGIALGLDRIVMLLTNTSNIRDVIAFPKTQSAACILTDAPSNISNEQMLELGIKILDEDK